MITNLLIFNLILMNIVMLSRRQQLQRKIIARRRQLYRKIVCSMRTLTTNKILSELVDMPSKVLLRVKPRIRSIWVKPRSSHFWEKIILTELDDDDFLEMFRMKRETFQMICEQIREEVKPKENYIIRKPVPVEKMLAVTLYKLASCCEYRVAGNVFGLHKSTVHKCFYKVIKAINKVLRSEYIKMPNSLEAQEIANSIECKTGFPQVIGAIDGTHIPILPPAEGYRDYVNRKGWPSLILQGVADHLYRFRDISIKFPGSCHDAVAFRNSNLYKRAKDVIPEGYKEISGKNINFLLLGDPAYPLLEWLQKPYTGVLDETEESYNCYLSSARIIIENAFGRLKARWRCLLKRVDISYKFVPQVVSACCVLHNIVETNKDGFIENWRNAVNESQVITVQPVSSATTQRSWGNAENIRSHLKRYITDNFPLRRSSIHV